MTNSILLTHHAKIRLAQRGIAQRHIDLVIKFGSIIRKQGYDFYYINHSNMVKKVLPAEAKYVRHLIVVVSPGYSPLVVTAYKEEGAVRNINKKSKNLIGYIIKEAV